MLRLVLLATLAVIVSACATGPAEYSGTDAGYIVMSVGRGPQSLYEWYEVALRKLDNSGDQRVRYHPIDKPGSMIGVLFVSRPDYGDIHMGDGIVEVRRLPPGDYEIYAYRATAVAAVTATSQSAQVFEYNWEPSSGPNIRFRVVPGQTTYIGSFTFVGAQTTNWIGTPVPAGGHLAVTDERLRDISFAQAKKPGLPDVRFEDRK